MVKFNLLGGGLVVGLYCAVYLFGDGLVAGLYCAVCLPFWWWFGGGFI